jgi:nitrate/TMAO reductase-like tetraheme cytochrome c subunit
MCHEMTPFVAGLARSPHARMEGGCAGCHIKGDVLSTMRAKLNGVRDVAIHVKRIFVDPEPIWISDWGLELVERNCIACHRAGYTKDLKHIEEFSQRDSRRCSECHSDVSHPPTKKPAPTPGSYPR